MRARPVGSVLRAEIDAIDRRMDIGREKVTEVQEAFVFIAHQGFTGGQGRGAAEGAAQIVLCKQQVLEFVASKINAFVAHHNRQTQAGLIASVEGDDTVKFVNRTRLPDAQHNRTKAMLLRQPDESWCDHRMISVENEPIEGLAQFA